MKWFQKGNSWIFAIILYVVSFLGITFVSQLRRPHERMFIDSSIWSNPKIAKSLRPLRGSNYFVDEPVAKGLIFKLVKNKDTFFKPFLKDPDGPDAVLTGWALSHVMLYAFLGFFTPKLWLGLFVIGCLFELFEYAVVSAHDVADILWNSLGFLIGVAVRHASNVVG